MIYESATIIKWRDIVQQADDNAISCMYVFVYVCMYVCMFVSIALLFSTYMLAVLMKCMNHFICVLLVRSYIAFYNLFLIRCFAVCMYVLYVCT